MNKLNINAIALAVTLAFSAGAMAEGMSKVDYKAGQAELVDVFLIIGGKRCVELLGHGGIIWVAQVGGHDAVQPGAHRLDGRLGLFVLARGFFGQLADGGFAGVAVFARLFDGLGNGRNKRLIFLVHALHHTKGSC